MKSRRWVAPSLALALISCTTSHSSKDWTSLDMRGAAARAPSSERDYISEIENATNDSRVSHLEASPEILNVQARMNKLFQLIDSVPLQMLGQMREKRPILLMPGAKGWVLDPATMASLKGTTKELSVPPFYIVTRYQDVLEVLHNNTVFTVGAYAGPIDATVGAPFMLARDESPANEEKPDMRHSLDGQARAGQVRAIVAHLTKEAIRAGAGQGAIDIVKTVTRNVPLGLNAEYFGFNGLIKRRWRAGLRPRKRKFFTTLRATQKF